MLQPRHLSLVSPTEEAFWERVLLPSPTRCRSSRASGLFVQDQEHTPPRTQMTRLSPIHTLPYDVLVEVFHFATCSSSEIEETGTTKRNPKYDLDALMKLAHVSRAWRNLISCHMHSTWSAIAIHHPRTKATVLLTELWLLRTGSRCPLHLTLILYSYDRFEVRTAEAVWKLFLRYVERWHTVNFDFVLSSGESLQALPTPENLVEVVFAKLQLRSKDRPVSGMLWDTFNRSKELRRVSWKEFIPESTPWSQLEEICSTVYNIEALIQNLPQVTNLTFLSIHSANPDSITGYHRDASILPNLRILDLSGQASGLVAILDRIATPVLEDLRIELPPQYSANGHTLVAVRRLFSRSDCQLVNLKIKSDSSNKLGTPNFLREVKENLRKLKRLEVVAGMHSDELALLLAQEVAWGDDTPNRPSPSSTSPFRSRAMVFLPCLQVLKGTWVPNVDGLLATMIQSRIHKGCLRVADIDMGITFRSCFPKNDALLLGSLKEEGWDVQWKIVYH